MNSLIALNEFEKALAHDDTMKLSVESINTIITALKIFPQLTSRAHTQGSQTHGGERDNCQACLLQDMAVILEDLCQGIRHNHHMAGALGNNLLHAQEILKRYDFRTGKIGS